MDEKDSKHSEKLSSLNDLDAKIRALEARIQESSSESEESEASQNESSLNPSKKKVLRSEFDKIPPLPQELLPAPGISSLKELENKNKTREENDEDSSFAGKICEVCPKKPFFKTKTAWMKHKRDLIHRQNVVLAAGAVYQPSSHRALYCRVCQLEFENEENLYDHRKTEAHRAATELDRKSSYCQICRKQFTSAAQLHEHCKGKAHQTIVREKQDKWKKAKRRRLTR